MMVSERYTASIVRGRLSRTGRREYRYGKDRLIYGATTDLRRFLFSLFPSSLQMDAEMYSAALVPIYQTKHRHISEGSNPHSHSRDNQKP